MTGEPHLCFFAVDDIQQGEEITCDYGSEDCPWKTQVCLMVHIIIEWVCVTEQKKHLIKLNRIRIVESY